LKDELNLRYLLPKNLLDIERASGSSFELQSSIKRTLNNLNFDKHKILSNQNPIYPEREAP
jgi:hypothetical protein